jgi:chromosome segregation ATPase
MFAKRTKQSTRRQPPTDDGSQTDQSGSHARGAAPEHAEDDAQEQRATAQSLREELDAARFKIEMLEKSYAKQLAELRAKLATTQEDLKTKEEILANLGGGHEHTLRELNDALVVIKVLKKERDQLRKQVAQGGFRQPELRPTIASRMVDDVRVPSMAEGARTPREAQDTSDGTINSMIESDGWAERKPHMGSGQAAAKVEAPEPEPSKVEMLSPDLVFTANDKEEDER